MIIIGITGGLASGKSTVSNIFQTQYSAYIFDADFEAKLLLNNKQISKQILSTFPDLHDVKPASLSKIVFKNENSQKKLNKIIHPALNKVLKKRIDEVGESKKYSFFIVDAALIIEGGSYKYYHDSGAYILLITSLESIRIDRALLRGNLSEESIKERIDLQWKDDIKKEYADYILENNSTINDLESSIKFLIKEIKENAKFN